MTCLCSAKLGPLMVSLQALPSALSLLPAIPPMPLNVVASASLALTGGLGLGMSASVGAMASVAANLAAMASLSAALDAALGMNLAAALSASMQARVAASLAASIGSFNALAGSLGLHASLLAKLMLELAPLVSLAGLVLAVRTAFGIDLQASGAILALQARLGARVDVKASVTANAAVNVAGHASLTAHLMAALGLKANAAGALSAGVMASATAGLIAGLPPIGEVSLLAMLSAVMAMVATIQLGLGVNVLLPGALISLQLVLAALPLSALAELNAAASATASASASAAANVAVSADATAGLDLAGVASVDLAAAGQLVRLLNLMASAKLGLPAGSCGAPCPLALLAHPAAAGVSLGTDRPRVTLAT